MRRFETSVEVLEKKLLELHKKAHNTAFNWYMRKGHVPFSLLEILKATKSVPDFVKFNPYHDELGRFTFSPDGGNPEGEPKIPRQYGVTVNSGTQIVIHHPDGSDEIRSGGDKNWRNNNPGNLRYGAFAERHGAIGDANGFAVFPDEQTGYDASAALFQSPSYSSLTIGGAIAQRSPSTENDTAHLQQDITARAGLSGMRIVGSLDDNEFSRFLEAVHWYEGHTVGTVVRTAPK